MRNDLVVTSQELRLLLDGESSIGTTPADCLIAARNDVEAAKAFLKEYQNQPNTYRAYRKEIERFMLWIALVFRRPIAQVRREDLDDLFGFYRSPPPDWCYPKAVSRKSEQWRPFKSGVKEDSLQYAKRVLHSFFDYLVDARYIVGNPIALLRRQRQASTTVRAAREAGHARRHGLGKTVIAKVLAHLDALPEENRQESEVKHRLSALFAMFFYTGARREEIAQAQAEHLEFAGTRCWLHVIGKGGKHAKLPLPAPALSALQRYCDVREEPFYSDAPSERPLISRIGDPDKPITGSMVYKALKRLFADVGVVLRQEGDTIGAATLERASTHWLRHSAIRTVLDATQDLQLTKGLGRHDKLDTTMLYLNQAEQDFHDRICEVFEGTAKEMSGSA